MSQTRPERIARSTSRFAGVSRIGLRVVIVAGFAGAAWALSASAANAAADTPSATSATDTSATPLTSSVNSLVGSLGEGTLKPLLGNSRSGGTSSGAITDTVLTPLDNVLTKTAKPLLSTGSGVLAQVLAPTNTVLTQHGTVAGTAPAPRHLAAVSPVRHAPDVVFGVTTTEVAAPATDQGTAAPAANPVVAQSVGPNDAVSNDANGVGSQDLVRIVTNVVAPLGLDQILQAPLDMLQPMIGIADPVLEPLVELLSPVTDVLCDVTTPVFDSLGALTRPLTGVVVRSTDELLMSVAPRLVRDHPALGTPIPSAIATAQDELTMFGQTPVRVESDSPGLQASASTGSRAGPAHRRVHAAGVDRQNDPARPVPFQAPPAAALGGISTTGSGSHQDNGGSAAMSTPIVNGSAAQHRLLSATGFAVRSQVTESPTVSPD